MCFSVYHKGRTIASAQSRKSRGLSSVSTPQSLNPSPLPATLSSAASHPASIPSVLKAVCAVWRLYSQNVPPHISMTLCFYRGLLGVRWVDYHLILLEFPCHRKHSSPGPRTINTTYKDTLIVKTAAQCCGVQVQ